MFVIFGKNEGSCFHFSGPLKNRTVTMYYFVQSVTNYRVHGCLLYNLDKLCEREQQMSLTFFFQTPHQVVGKRTVDVTDIFLSDSPPKGPPSFFPCTPESINSKPDSNKRVCHKTLSVSHSQGIFCLSGSEAQFAENLQLLANSLPCLHMYSQFFCVLTYLFLHSASFSVFH